MTDFICAYFGKDWTITARGFESLEHAESHGKFMMPIPGCLGFAAISEKPDAWIVFDQFSMLSGKEYITRDDFQNFTVSFSW